MKFSVLMSVYYKDNPFHLEEALQSISEQTLKPDEIIIVKDGQLPVELVQILENYQKNIPDNVKIFGKERNSGLGEALKFGLAKCNNEWVARMDADDICDKNRFFEQIQFLKNNKNIDVLGCSAEEFRLRPGDLKQERKMPVSHSDIYQFAKLRSPVNHPTCIYKKSKVIEAGNYNSESRLEDYWLFVRMLKQNCIFHNLERSYYNFRVGNNMEMLKRRTGLKYAKEDFKFAKMAYSIKFFNVFEFIKYVVIKVPVRILPVFAISFIYKFFLRKKSS